MSFTIHEPIGGGRAGNVYRATDERLRRDVAIKIIRPEFENVADALAHGQALARVQHENVVVVYSTPTVTDPTDGQLRDAVAMELIDGDTLEKVLAAGELKAERAKAIGLGLVAGIEAVHGVGLVHGDLHEENVLVAGNVAKVIDILYLNSLAAVSAQRRDQRERRDHSQLMIMLLSLARAANVLTRSLEEILGRGTMSFPEARNAFNACFLRERPTAPPLPTNPSGLLALSAARIDAVSRGDTPVHLAESGPLLVLHLLPMEAVGPKEVLEVGRIPAGRCVWLPLTGGANGEHFDSDGYFVCSNGLSDVNSGYLRIFPNGVVEAVSALLCFQFREPADGEGMRIPTRSLENDVMSCLHRSVGGLADHGFHGPFAITLSLLRATGSGFMWDRDGNVRNRFRKPRVDFSHAVLQRSDTDIGRAMRPIFDRVWQAAGRPGSPGYTETGDWQRHV